MEPPPANFDRLAGLYRLLEFLAFGRDLERARFCLLETLANCRSILILGEGDGRGLARLVRISPQARIDCVDASSAMILLASRRLARTGAGGRVNFVRADVFSLEFPPARYDAVVTFFFLDCFSSEQVARLIRRLQPSLLPGSRWLYADFAVPGRGWARLRARAWLSLLYAFFRWQTGLSARALPNSERLLLDQGWRPEKVVAWQGGMIRSSVYRRADNEGALAEAIANPAADFGCEAPDRPGDGQALPRPGHRRCEFPMPE